MITTGLDFWRREFAPAAFRVTIAAFNVRARRVATSLGLRNVGRFAARTDGQGYEMLVRAELAAAAPDG